jgi:hypothetical protein
MAQAGSSAGPAPSGLPRRPAPPPVAGGISAQTLASRIDQFLASRGYRPPSEDAEKPLSPSGGPAVSTTGPEPASFVCEEDVRLAIRSGSKITLGDRTIVTPAARDLGEAHKVFVQAGWPR